MLDEYTHKFLDCFYKQHSLIRLTEILVAASIIGYGIDILAKPEKTSADNLTQTVLSQTERDSLMARLGQEEFMFEYGLHLITPRAKGLLEQYSEIIQNSYHDTFDISSIEGQNRKEDAFAGLVHRAREIGGDLIITSDEATQAYKKLSDEIINRLIEKYKKK